MGEIDTCKSSCDYAKDTMGRTEKKWIIREDDGGHLILHLN